MRVFVAGGTGVVGRRLVPQLVARGHHVTATATGPGKLGMLEQLGADAVVMDGLDGVSVGEAVAAARPDVIVQQMTAIAGRPNMRHLDRCITNRLRTEGTDHLLAAAEATGVPHVVAQANASWNGIRQGGRVKTEEDPLDLYVGTPAHAVMEATSRTRSVRPTAQSCDTADSPGQEPPRTRSNSCASGSSRLSGCTGYSSWVHLDDAASATVLAVEQQARGVYNIVDDEPAPAREWLPYVAACAGAKPPMRILTWLARLLAGEVAVTMMAEGRGFSNAKAKRELGWTSRYPSWRQGFKKELA
ncbi:MAG TPA: NAD(P)-dependent oxidoreductase [Actinophytocola sp.]|nr:NAD(P)-dependent oxidoreductase [Actinophytocola sp.]